MTIVVVVKIPQVDIERVRQVEKTHAHLNAQVKDALQRHGCVAHRRLFRGDEIMDVDEWRTEAGVQAFLAEMGPVIRELATARGTGQPTDAIWQIY